MELLQSYSHAGIGAAHENRGCREYREFNFYFPYGQLKAASIIHAFSPWDTVGPFHFHLPCRYPIEVECVFSVVSGYLQSTTERGLLGILSAALKIRVRTADALIRMQCRFRGPCNALNMHSTSVWVGRRP